jgi:hypothetical protein
MSRLSKLTLTLAGAAVGTAIALGVPTAANAATVGPDSDPYPTIAPGGIGNIGAGIGNVGAAPITASVVLYLTAPTNATFTADELWGFDVVQGVRSAPKRYFSNCVRSNGNTKIQCSGPITVPGAQGGMASYVDIRAEILVSSSAPNNTTYGNGIWQMTNSSDNLISGGTASMGYRTPTVVATPVVSPLAAGAVGLIGVAGAGTVALRRRRTATAA